MTGQKLWRSTPLLAISGVLAMTLVALAGLPPAEVTRAGSLNVSLDLFATGFTELVSLANAGDSRLFAVEREGYIYIVESDGTVLPTPFLDIDSKVGSGGSEQGLLGLAFHPDYAANGFFYVNYTNNDSPDPEDTVIARYSVTGNPNLADPNSEVILLTITQPNSNHNGGNLIFGPDGYLYIGMGDGGGSGDPGENGQDPTTLLGKILRIDVDQGGANDPDTCGMTAGTGYTIPPDNPFLDGAGGDCDEIWSLGLRNPWRFNFDALTGDLYIGDVGQNIWEEVDFQPAASTGAENWGWDCYEGNVAFELTGCGPIGNYDFPFFVYQHGAGECSVTGGFVYRGGLYPELYGYYLFADYCSGRFWAAIQSPGWVITDLGDKGSLITTFGQNSDLELYVADGVNIYHIEEDTLLTPTPSRTPTRTLTPTPTKTSTATLTPTNTPTRTPTSTPTSTSTNTLTPTNTPTHTPTNTATITPSPTITLTSTATPVLFPESYLPIILK